MTVPFDYFEGRIAQMTEDHEIVALYFCRDEAAIRLTEEKYGRYLAELASRFLRNAEDAADSVNDAYLDAWNSIPPHKPEKLGAYLANLTRRRAIDRLRRDTARRRGGNAAFLSLDELSDCIPAQENVEEQLDGDLVQKALTSFLCDLPEDRRRMFLCRYFYAMSLSEIAKLFEIPEGRAANILMRLRKKLRERLLAAGIAVDG